MTRGQLQPTIQLPALGFTNEHESRGENFFWVISESLSDFFFFCSVNPNLKDLKLTFSFETESLFVFFWMKRREKKKKSHRGISFLSVQESSPPSGEASLSLTFHISPLSGRSAGKRQAVCRQWRLTAVSVRGWSGVPSESSLQMVLNVGDWGAVPSVPCPLPGPVKPNGICHKSGSRRGLCTQGCVAGALQACLCNK